MNKLLTDVSDLNFNNTSSDKSIIYPLFLTPYLFLKEKNKRTAANQ